MKISNRKVVMQLLVLFILAWTNAYAQTAPLWNGLRPGAYSVGFKVLWKYDYSRTWQQEKDFEGKELTSEVARPMRIKVWYPAVKNAGSAAMQYSGYLNVNVADKNFAEFNKRIEDYDLKSIWGFFKSEALVNKLLKTPMAAFLNSPGAKGNFPLVVFSVGQNDHTLENIVLWEFLASHGYVVATIPHLGTSQRRFQLLVHDSQFYEAQVRDLEFVIQQMNSFPNTNAEKLALMGHSFGGVYSLLTAMRNSKVDAVVGLDPTFVSKIPSFYYKYWEAPYYDPARLKAPLLVLYKGVNSDSLTWDIVNNLKFSDRYLLRFERSVHGDFNSTPMIVSLAPPGEDFADREYALKFRTKEEGIIGHKIICQYVLNFLNANLKGDKQAMKLFASEPTAAEIPKNFITREFKPGFKAPNEEEFYTIIQEQGIDVAIKIYRAAKSKYPDENIIRDASIRRIGNEMIYYNEPAKAVEVFKLYVEAFPQSAEAFDRLAEGYMLTGDKEMAIKHYKKSLELNPQNSNAVEQIKKLSQK